MLVSTSRIRLTSSILAMPRKTVRPRFSRLAHSSATAAFLDERTSMAAVELGAALHPQVQRTVAADRDQRGVQRPGDPVDHLQAKVLVAGLDPVHRALAGAQHVGELGLGQTPVLAGIADQAPDLVQIRFGHAGTITHM